MHALDRFVKTFTIWLALIGGLGFAGAILVTCTSAIGKGISRILNNTLGADSIPTALSWIKPIRGEDEIVAFAVGFALFAAIPLAMYARSHVTVDLFEKRFSDWTNRLLDLLGDIFLAVLAWLIFSQQWNLIFKPARVSRGQDPLFDVLLARDWATVAKRFIDNQETQVLGLHYWPMHIWAEFCVGVFLLVSCYCVVRSFRALQYVKRDITAAKP